MEKDVTNILKFPQLKRAERRKARDVIAALVNSTDCNNEISTKLARLVEAMDKHNHNVVKFQNKEPKDGPPQCQSPFEILTNLNIIDR